MIEAKTAREITNNSYVRILNELEHNIKEVAQCGQYSYRWEFDDSIDSKIVELIIKQLEEDGFVIWKDVRNKVAGRLSYIYCYIIDWDIVE